MDEFLKAIVAAGWTQTQEAIEKNRTQILAAASKYGVTIAMLIEHNVDQAIQASNFGFLGNAIKSAVISGLNEAIENLADEAPAQEAAFLDFIIAAANSYVKQATKE